MSAKEFNNGVKAFKVAMPRKNAKLKPNFPAAILSFFTGIMTLEWNEIAVNIRAQGVWEGKAEFNCSVLFALILAPLNGDELIIKFENNKLYFGTTAIPCKWSVLSEGFISKVKDPQILDIFAMWKVTPSHLLHTKKIPEQYKAEYQKMMISVEKSLKLLSAYEITNEDLISLIDAKVLKRIKE